ncbi:hypothetical protein JHW43_001268 [Diplocarpon mali]|nr:hypothetical protein JHW43_001268 [Diplocarpon mali]
MAEGTDSRLLRVYSSTAAVKPAFPDDAQVDARGTGRRGGDLGKIQVMVRTPWPVGPLWLRSVPYCLCWTGLARLRLPSSERIRLRSEIEQVGHPSTILLAVLLESPALGTPVRMPAHAWHAAPCLSGPGHRSAEEDKEKGRRRRSWEMGYARWIREMERLLEPSGAVRFALIAGSHEAAVRPGGERATFRQSLWGLGSQTMWAVISRRGDSGSVPPPPVQHGRLHAASKPVCDAVGEAEIDGGATARHKGATKTQTVMDWGREERFQCPRPLGRSSSNQSSLMADTHDMIQSQAQRQATGGFLEGFVPC